MTISNSDDLEDRRTVVKRNSLFERWKCCLTLSDQLSVFETPSSHYFQVTNITRNPIEDVSRYVYEVFHVLAIEYLLCERNGVVSDNRTRRPGLPGDGGNILISLSRQQ